MKRGILPQRAPQSYGKAGQDLRQLFKVGDKTYGNVYAFENLEDAIRYGANRQWESKMPYTILRINESPDMWQHDKAVEGLLGYKGAWLTRPHRVPAERIVDTIDITDDLIRKIVGGK